MTSSPAKDTRRESFTLVLLVACLVLSVLVVVLAWQNWSMKRMLAATHSTELPPDALRPGDRLAAFDVVDASGAPLRIDFGEASPTTLLLVFSSTCPACERNMPTWNELLAEPPPPAWRVVAIQADAAQGGLDPAPHRFPVFRIEPAQGPPLDRVPFVPATIVVGPTGEVISASFGVLGDDDRAVLETRLDAG